ncbi:MAG TPA: hypothetical protein VFB66_01840 [Tepidisphaeraceae bacterium]|nr:hypothetical protein [Tepidisphaeraceae bacterium]
MNKLGWALVLNVAFVLAILATLFAFSPRRARGAEGNARWSRADLPVQLAVAPEAADHMGAVARAAWILNRACSCELFLGPRLVSIVWVKDFYRGGHGIRGVVLVRADGEFVPPHGHSEPVFSRPGRMFSVVVTLPRERIPDWQLRGMILHELGHATGHLQHSDDPESAFFEVVLPGQHLRGPEWRWLRGYRQ